MSVVKLSRRQAWLIGLNSDEDRSTTTMKVFVYAWACMIAEVIIGTDGWVLLFGGFFIRTLLGLAGTLLEHKVNEIDRAVEKIVFEARMEEVKRRIDGLNSQTDAFAEEMKDLAELEEAEE